MPDHNKFNNYLSLAVLAVSAILAFGGFYSQGKDLPQRMNSVEIKMSAVETNILGIKDDLKWIRDQMEHRNGRAGK